MINTYPMSVVLSGATGRTLTSIPASGWKGLNDLASHLNVAPDALPGAIFAQHPELDVDTSEVTDWESWMLDMVRQFGPALKFEGRGE